MWDKTGRIEVGVGYEGDGDVEAFRRRKLLICRADKVNSDGLECHGETNITWESRCFI